MELVGISGAAVSIQITFIARFYSPRKARIWANIIFLICHKIFPAGNAKPFWYFLEALF